MKEISKENLEKRLEEATNVLLQMGREASWNTISSQTLYILTEIDPKSQLNAFEERKLRKKINKKKNPRSLKSVTQELLSFYDDLYDINLYIYKSKRKQTIVEIQYFLKSFHDQEYRQTVIDNPPMLHCKSPLPPYRKEDKKFDINWAYGGLRHQWNLFWWSRKMKKRIYK